MEQVRYVNEESQVEVGISDGSSALGPADTNAPAVVTIVISCIAVVSGDGAAVKERSEVDSEETNVSDSFSITVGWLGGCPGIKVGSGGSPFSACIFENLSECGGGSDSHGRGWLV